MDGDAEQVYVDEWRGDDEREGEVARFLLRKPEDETWTVRKCFADVCTIIYSPIIHKGQQRRLLPIGYSLSTTNLQIKILRLS